MAVSKVNGYWSLINVIRAELTTVKHFPVPVLDNGSIEKYLLRFPCAKFASGGEIRALHDHQRHYTKGVIEREMRYSGYFNSSQQKTKVYKFGYDIGGGHISWKSGSIKNDVNFRHLIAEVMFSEDTNKFSSLVVLLDISPSGGVPLMTGSVGNTFAEFILMAQPDNITTSMPSTAKFKNATLGSAVPLMQPGETTLVQQLTFTFSKGKASWDDE